MSADFFNKYPYTDFHELNLDWLLGDLKQLQDSYQGIIDWIENDAANFNELKSRISFLETETVRLQEQISSEKIRVNAKFALIDNEFTAQYNHITSEYTSMYSAILINVDAALYNIRNTMEAYRIELINRMDDGDEALRGWVEARLEQFIEDLPDYEQLIIYNPVEGIQTNIQTAINDLYTYFNAYALTAQQYDNLMLTADEYDGYQLTAYEYDSQGMQYLGAGFYLMRSPFTGTLTPIPTVINMLFELHRTAALTASAYDALDMTAAYYDGLNLTASYYDMNGV